MYSMARRTSCQQNKLEANNINPTGDILCNIFDPSNTSLKRHKSDAPFNLDYEVFQPNFHILHTGSKYNMASSF